MEEKSLFRLCDTCTEQTICPLVCTADYPVHCKDYEAVHPEEDPKEESLWDDLKDACTCVGEDIDTLKCTHTPVCLKEANASTFEDSFIAWGMKHIFVGEHSDACPVCIRTIDKDPVRQDAYDWGKILAAGKRCTDKDDWDSSYGE